MINQLKLFLNNQLNTQSPSAIKQEVSIQLATACLITATLHADYKISPEETDKIKEILTKEFKLNDNQAEELITLAKTQIHSNTSLFEFTSVINQEYSYLERCKIIKLLWQAAFADHHIHHYEEHLIRRIADLIYVSHSDFIQAKLQVMH